jgi:peptidoglycan/xylan/chitin deacetylase (PgdA/CDA1 family)
MQAGTFIVSLDCEGKWGMADHLDESHEKLTDDALYRAYETLLGIFDSYDISATFAFVMAFALDRKTFSTMLPDDPWLEHYTAAIKTQRKEGWHVPAALAAVKAAARHEVACQGLIHRPLNDSYAEQDLAAARRAADQLGINPTTLVYPRNVIGDPGLLARHGFIGYRTRLRRLSGGIGRAMGLADELNMWPRSQPRIKTVNGVVPIPSGYFVNWRHGARRNIPRGVTNQRMVNLVKHAARTGGVAHIWLHPHNLITAPDTVEALQEALGQARREEDGQRLRVMTQAQYCDEMLKE